MSYTLSLKDKISLVVNAKQLRIEDETDYQTLPNPPINDRRRVFKISVNGVVFYDTNFANPSGTTPATFAQWAGVSDMDTGDDSLIIALPTNTDGSIVEGEYTVESRTIYPTTNAKSAYKTDASLVKFDIAYDKVKGELEVEVDLSPKPVIKWTDTTKYTQNSKTPTISRELKYFSPSGSQIGNTTTTFQIVSNTVYTSVSFATLASTVSYSYDAKESSGYSSVSVFLLDVVSARKTVEVGDDLNLCNIYCCIKELKDKWEGLVAKGRLQKAAEVFAKFQEASSLLQFVMFSSRCGKTKGLNETILKIKEITECNEDCGCSGEEPQLIPDLSGDVSTLNQVIAFNVGTGTDFVDGSLVFTRNVNGNSTVTDPRLINKTFNNTKRDFDVYFDGVIELSGSFNSTTGTFTFGQTLSNDVNVMIRLY